MSPVPYLAGRHCSCPTHQRHRVALVTGARQYQQSLSRRCHTSFGDPRFTYTENRVGIGCSHRDVSQGQA